LSQRLRTERHTGGRGAAQGRSPGVEIPHRVRDDQGAAGSA